MNNANTIAAKTNDLTGEVAIDAFFEQSPAGQVLCIDQVRHNGARWVVIGSTIYRPTPTTLSSLLAMYDQGTNGRSARLEDGKLTLTRANAFSDTECATLYYSDLRGPAARPGSAW